MEEQNKVVWLVPREDGHPAAGTHLPGADLDRARAETLDELAQRLSRVASTWRKSDFARMVSECRLVAQLADELGLERLGGVACATAALGATHDGVALAANVARLTRLGEGALSAIWDLQDAQS
ncbi:hypothetical protein [Tranquillimonas alkanivorans]|uniref:Hpt domain-containing protein n=1 Tax=Tranquillimonas alkanivorans TaxID=441119 RepID=A0A1I5L874_9RHOB|nr:hypothetical protein [Tranquillimonas alkanivorans]SFO93382.1 hypothetical protein SAMN04488047_101512 [Tranquillimonas alkanivorans]